MPTGENLIKILMSLKITFSAMQTKVKTSINFIRTLGIERKLLPKKEMID
jgi:hypothetical protein